MSRQDHISLGHGDLYLPAARIEAVLAQVIDFVAVKEQLDRRSWEEVIATADAMIEVCGGLGEQEWDALPLAFIDYCDKQCYAERVLAKGSVREFGVRGVYQCSDCGYAWQRGAR